ncbi:MAG: DUF1735 domain-containing protein [Candidatus Pseudobacter hemicellulosilyticus]|uniref:DUF1735 domain-containing protein n=1 Tax=Candidatus Pseudobacter hemicellulosilyticus TaxID=3121375 RepID=A0AAJ5WPI6_9BACT|nr:MAG: DUF1735 domain-containing protein [Pseudobacter sp.]
MLTIRLLTGMFLLATLLEACETDIYLPEQPLASFIHVYMPQAVNGVVKKTVKLSGEPQSIPYGASYGAQEYPTEDIQVQFGVNENAIDSFNRANSTQYALLPAPAFTMTANAIIPKGQLWTEPLDIHISTTIKEIEAGKTYLLPVRIEASSVKISEQLRTTWFLIKVE